LKEKNGQCHQMDIWLLGVSAMDRIVSRFEKLPILLDAKDGGPMDTNTFEKQVSIEPEEVVRKGVLSKKLEIFFKKSSNQVTKRIIKSNRSFNPSVTRSGVGNHKYRSNICCLVPSLD
jgi:hypothetical protein